MSTMQNKDLVHRYIDEVFNQGNLAAADQYLSPGFVDHNPLTPDQPPGPAGQKQVYARFREAFPDLYVTLEALVAEGNMVANRATISGQQRGSILGIPPTGKRVSWQAMTIFRVANGQIVERWSTHDLLGLLRQLGIIPEGIEVPAVR
jgi:steroid delta-isomerase-like uncharacterized protein